MNPHNFGVVILDPNDEERGEFLRMINKMWSNRNHFKLLTLHDCKYGEKVIYMDPRKKPDKNGIDNNKWNQRWARCVITGPVFPDGCEKLSPARQANARVQIYMLDWGTTQVVFLKHLRRFHEKSCNYGMPDAFSG